MNPTDEQVDIIETFKKGENMFIYAGPGTGKSSTLLMLMEHVTGKNLVLSFNSKISKEIEGKIVDKGLDGFNKTKTLHSLGKSLLSANGFKCYVDKNKFWNLFKVFQKDTYVKNYLKNFTFKFAQAVRRDLENLNDLSRLYLDSDFEAMCKRGKETGRPIYSCTADLWEVFLNLREESYTKPIKWNSIPIDFLDMIYLPVKLDRIKVKFELESLMIDEVQDLDNLQFEFFKKIIKESKCERWVSVGDYRQSVYGFRGALPEISKKFKELNPTIKKLSLCFRCRPGIVNLANTIYPGLTSALEGNSSIREINLSSSIKDSSLVVCRNGSPLVLLYFQMLKEGRNVTLVGKDIKEKIKSFLKTYKNFTINEMEQKLENELFELIAQKEKGESQAIKYYMFKDNYEMYVAIRTNIPFYCSRVVELIDYIDELFSHKPGAIQLMTIHKSKGLENKSVTILNKDLIPSPMAKTKNALVQENNLLFVAITRAKEDLYFYSIDV